MYSGEQMLTPGYTQTMAAAEAAFSLIEIQSKMFISAVSFPLILLIEAALEGSSNKPISGEQLDLALLQINSISWV